MKATAMYWKTDLWDRASWCSLHNGDYGQRKEAKKFKDRKLLLLKKANIELNNYQF